MGTRAPSAQRRRVVEAVRDGTAPSGLGVECSAKRLSGGTVLHEDHNETVSDLTTSVYFLAAADVLQ